MNPTRCLRAVGVAAMLMFVLCAPGGSAASMTAVPMQDATLETPPECPGVFERFGSEGAAQDGWRLAYQFPRVTYGFAQRNAENRVHLSPVPVVEDPIFSLEIRNLAATEHMFFLRVVDADGAVWDSRPVALDWTNAWRRVTIPAAEMRRASSGEPGAPKAPLGRLSLVVQQSMSARLASNGFFRRGEIHVRDLAVGPSAGNAPDPLVFEGRVFAKPLAVAPTASGEIPLQIPAGHRSKNFPIRLGVPFPEGVLVDEAHLALLANGAPVPCQSSVLSRWPDGSLRVVAVKFAADLTGAVDYRVAYGPRVERVASAAPPLCRETGDGIVIDTGVQQIRFDRSSPALLDALADVSADGALAPVFGPEGCRATLRGTNGVLHALSGKRTAVEENGPLFAVVKVEGVFSNALHAVGYPVLARFYFMRGVPFVKCAFTFINASGETANPMPEITLRGAWAQAHETYAFGAADAHAGAIPEAGISLFQDGAVYDKGDLRHPYRITAGDRTLAEGDRFDGRATSAAGARRVGIGVFECWQNNPKRVALARDGFAIGLSTLESCRNGTPRGHFYHGMAKTQTLGFDFGGGEALDDFLAEPLLLPSAQWLSASGVFGAMDPEDRERFPAYEQAREDWVKTFVEWPKRFGDQYGLRDFGDYFGDAPHGWMNLETAVGMALFRQFARTGRREYFSLARQAVSHYGDIDTCHAEGLGKDPRRELGAVFGHTWHHAGVEGTLERKTQSYLGVGGHDWYSELVYVHLLTGDEWLRDCAIQHADCTVYHIENYFKEDHVLAREYAWPVKNLCAVYAITNNPAYLQAASKVMNFFAHWREAFATTRFGGLGMAGICLGAIRDYRDTTRDPAAGALFEIAGRNMLAGLQFLPGETEPTACSYNEDGRVFAVDVAADLYAATGDKRFVSDLAGYLYFFIRNGMCDPTVFWCGPSFLQAMRKLGMEEPVERPFVPLLSGLGKAASGVGKGTVFATEAEDADFTLSVSRVAAFRLARVSRGLLVGDWEGYPDTDGLFVTNDTRLAAAHFGRIRIVAPDGRVVVEDELDTFASAVRHYRVPRDGQTGVYRMEVDLVDDLYHRVLVDSSLPRLAVANATRLPDRNPVYFRVPEGASFTVHVQSRKGQRYGGARLYGPDGALAGSAYWDPEGSGNVFSIPGAGGGVWRVERSMFSNASRIWIEGVPDVIGASAEAFEPAD